MKKKICINSRTGGRGSSRHHELVSGSIPVEADDNHETNSPTGQINIDRSRTKFGMTQSGIRQSSRHPEPPSRHSELVSGSKNNHHRAAFTLAEVLITLGIIGVVAAMTLPTLIHKYQAKVLKSYFKKSYAATSNAIMLAKANLGVGNFAEYCAYYNGSSLVNAQQCYDSMYEALQLNTKSMKLRNSTRYNILRTDTIKTYNNKEISFDNNNLHNEKMIFTSVIRNRDGSYIQFLINSSKFFIGIDTNGAKGPNRLGYDLFEFQVDKKNDSLGPVKQTRAYTDEELEDVGVGLSYETYAKATAGNPCNKNSNQGLNGIGCTWFAVNDIDPDTGEKGYWENLPK